MEINERYVVRVYRQEDKNALRILFQKLWAESSVEKFENHWWWRWEEPPLYVVDDTETKTIVGICAYIPFLLNFQEQEYTSAWFVDFHVLPQHQGRSIGKRLTNAVTDRFAITASLSQSDAAWAVFRRLGWQEQQSTRLYMNLFPLLPGSMRVIRLFSKNDASLRLETGPVLSDGSFNNEFDKLWLRLRHSFGASSVRNSAALQQRYGKQPDKRYLLLRCYRSDELAGYMILRICPPNSLRRLRRYPIGLIVDYLMESREATLFSAMLGEAIEYLLEQQARYLLCLSTVPAFHSVLAQHGFFHSGTPLIGRQLHVGFTFKSQSSTNALMNAPWHLTLGDCDMDLVWGS
jgi:GNAT superfamily N-acetyltransferase